MISLQPLPDQHFSSGVRGYVLNPTRNGLSNRRRTARHGVMNSLLEPHRLVLPKKGLEYYMVDSALPIANRVGKMTLQH